MGGGGGGGYFPITSFVQSTLTLNATCIYGFKSPRNLALRLDAGSREKKREREREGEIIDRESKLRVKGGSSRGGVS